MPLIFLYEPMKQIDILMATYNGERYIDDQIQSILRQSYPYWRLLIRDDGSSDGTIVKLKRYTYQDARIQVIQDSHGNLGVTGNFGLLLEMATAPYIMFADQDDVWDSDKIAAAVTAMTRQEKETPGEPILVFTNSMITNADMTYQYGPLYPSDLKYTLADFLFANSGYQGAAMLFNAKLRELVLPFPSELRVHDYYLSLVAHLQGKIVFVPQLMANYRRHAGAINPNNVKLSDRIRSFLDGNPILSHLDMQNCIERYVATHTLRANDKKIIDAYLTIINPRTTIVKRFYLAIKYRFTLRNSNLYLLLKLLMIRPK